MHYEQTLNFLEAVVVFLLLTNAISVAIAGYAMRLARVLDPKAARALTAMERKVETMIGRPV